MRFPARAAKWNFDLDHRLNRYLPPSQLHKLPFPVSRFLGYRSEPRPDVGNILGAFWSLVGAFCGLAVVVAVFNNVESIQRHSPPIIIASFGASAVLEYNVIRSPLGQPRNALLGHTFSALVGVAVTKLFLYHHDFDSIRWIAGSIACAIASAVMLLTNTVHPPGGASAVLAATQPEITAMGWYFVGLVMLGMVLMLLVGLAINNIQRQFPTYWWTPVDLSKRENADRENIPDAKGAVELRGVDVVRDAEIYISSDRVELPTHFSLNPEEAELLHRLKQRLMDRGTESEVNEESDDGRSEKDIEVPPRAYRKKSDTSTLV